MRISKDLADLILNAVMVVAGAGVFSMIYENCHPDLKHPSIQRNYIKKVEVSTESKTGISRKNNITKIIFDEEDVEKPFRYNLTEEPLAKIFDEYIQEHKAIGTNSKRNKFDKLIVIEKEPQILTVYVNNEPLKSYRVARSKVDGDKVFQGDRKTPEGIFWVRKHPHSQYYKALTLSYPTIDDALMGYQGGVISKTERDAVIKAHQKCQFPPQNTRLGNYVEIHGMGGYRYGNWTAGCVALENKEIDEIYKFVDAGCKGTKVIIVDKEYIPQNSLEQKE